MSATIASGIVRDMPNVATSGVVQTTETALQIVFIGVTILDGIKVCNYIV